MNDWIRSRALADLLQAFGAKNLTTESELGTVLEDLSEFSAANWDFRQGRERNQASTNEFDDVIVAQILASARALGLIGSSTPRRTSYSHVLILGGLVRACILRPVYTASLIKKGLHTNTITAIGGFRTLLGDEISLAEAAGLKGVTNEIEAMDLGVQSAFNLREIVEEKNWIDTENPNRSWLVRTYNGSNGATVQVVAAPSLDPEVRRANTSDTYKFWAENLTRLTHQDRVLLVTSEIYVPFQGAEAIRMLALPFGCSVETIGLDTASIPNKQLRQTFTPANYLQEINSTVRAISALYKAT